MFIRSFPVISTIGSAAMVTIIPSRYVKVFQESQLLPCTFIIILNVSWQSKFIWHPDPLTFCVLKSQLWGKSCRNIKILFKKYVFVTVSDLRSWGIFWGGEIYFEKARYMDCRRRCDTTDCPLCHHCQHTSLIFLSNISSSIYPLMH